MMTADAGGCWPERGATQTDVDQKSLRPGGWCPLAPQFQLMYAFDALIGNEHRTRDRIVYDAGWMLNRISDVQENAGRR